MSSKADVRMTPTQRLARGLKYTAVGPVDVTRGALGLGVNGAHSSAVWVGDRYRRSRVTDQLAAAQETVAAELAAAQQLVSSLPAALQKSRTRRRRRPLVLVGAGVAVLAGGAVVFSIVRRSMKPEPSPLPPSVEVTPKP
jgi:hypothetical protein